MSTLNLHKKVNQHAPNPPKDELKDVIEQFWRLSIADTEVVELLKEYYDTDTYNLSVYTYRKWIQEWGFLSTRKQAHNEETIRPWVEKVKKRFPTKGAEGLRMMLSLDHGVKAPRELINKVLHMIEPDAVAARKGVSDMYCLDQHDKFQRFGFRFHNAIDPFSGFNHWLKCWWTNKNPILINSYYLEAIRKDGDSDSAGYVPLTSLSDPGTENFGVANMHTEIRQTLDPTLHGTLQHRFMRKKKNIKSEINWSVYRRDFAPGFEDLFNQGILSGMYDPDNNLEYLVFRQIAIPFMQQECDAWMNRRNHSKPRADRHKVLPHGIPAMIKKFPHHYGAVDFKIGVPDSLLQKMETKYAPPDHAVFQLTPPEFNQRAVYFLRHTLGSPEINMDSFWDVYQNLLDLFRSETINNTLLGNELQEFLVAEEQIDSEVVELMEGQAELRYNGRVIGDADEEMDNSFFHHDSENYLEVDITDDEEEELEDSSSMLIVDFSDDSVEEVANSLVA
ncbi:MAG: hypothetical protein NXY57DRAFT_967953 [Lentinula lateritia]|nr:MAG: hypothetical protein NXY57DRAFT_967953 [Lentinula lateritia]